jgi:hypothetical protein
VILIKNLDSSHVGFYLDSGEGAKEGTHILADKTKGRSRLLGPTSRSMCVVEITGSALCKHWKLGLYFYWTLMLFVLDSGCF